jgi:hypothetical protein
MPGVRNLLIAACLAVLFSPAALAGKTRNVILVIGDGVRWQEVFTGADPLLLNDKAGGSWAPAAELKQKYWNDDPEVRRRLLFPFLWSTVAVQGQLFGNQQKDSVARVTNAMWFSYPGYNEMSSGIADPRINSNEFGPNPNVTVFEWLNSTPEFAGKVEIFGTWSVFADIFNEERSKLPVRAGATLVDAGDLTPRGRLLTEIYQTTTRLEGSDPYEAAHLVDAFVGDLWKQVQSLPEYRGRTTMIISADHGRGSGLIDWKDHGVQQKGSNNIWIGVIGPDTPPLGERHNVPPVTQSQIASTVAALVGQDFRAFKPAAAPSLLEALKGP